MYFHVTCSPRTTTFYHFVSIIEVHSNFRKQVFYLLKTRIEHWSSARRLSNCYEIQGANYLYWYNHPYNSLHYYLLRHYQYLYHLPAPSIQPYIQNKALWANAAALFKLRASEITYVWFHIHMCLTILLPQLASTILCTARYRIGLHSVRLSSFFI